MSARTTAGTTIATVALVGAGHRLGGGRRRARSAAPADGRPVADRREPTAVRAGSTARLALQVSLPEGYHVQSNAPREAAFIPTVLVRRAAGRLHGHRGRLSAADRPDPGRAGAAAGRVRAGVRDRRRDLGARQRAARRRRRPGPAALPGVRRATVLRAGDRRYRVAPADRRRGRGRHTAAGDGVRRRSRSATASSRRRRRRCPRQPAAGPAAASARSGLAARRRLRRAGVDRRLSAGRRFPAVRPRRRGRASRRAACSKAAARSRSC